MRRLKNILVISFAFLLAVSFITPINASTPSEEVMTLYDGTQIFYSEVEKDSNLVKSENFYLENEEGEQEEFTHKVYELNIPKERMVTNDLQNTQTKVALAVVRGTGHLTDSGSDSTGTYRFYAEIDYTTSTLSTGQTAYDLTSVYGNASTGSANVSLTSYYVLIGQIGTANTGYVANSKQVNIDSWHTFNINTTSYDWPPVAAVGYPFTFAVGQTQYYTIQRGTSTWSGNFTLNI